MACVSVYSVTVCVFVDVITDMLVCLSFQARVAVTLQRTAAVIGWTYAAVSHSSSAGCLPRGGRRKEEKSVREGKEKRGKAWVRRKRGGVNDVERWASEWAGNGVGGRERGIKVRIGVVGWLRRCLGHKAWLVQRVNPAWDVSCVSQPSLAWTLMRKWWALVASMLSYLPHPSSVTGHENLIATDWPHSPLCHYLRISTWTNGFVSPFFSSEMLFLSKVKTLCRLVWCWVTCYSRHPFTLQIWWRFYIWKCMLCIPLSTSSYRLHFHHTFNYCRGGFWVSLHLQKNLKLVT